MSPIAQHASEEVCKDKAAAWSSMYTNLAY